MFKLLIINNKNNLSNIIQKLKKMEHINRMIKTNKLYEGFEDYDRKMKGISRITNWHETKVFI